MIQMCNWGQSPFARAKKCNNGWLYQVTKGDRPQWHMKKRGEGGGCIEIMFKFAN
jgi:hypothetical protein